MIDSEEGGKKLYEIRTRTDSPGMNDKIGNGTGCTANVVLMTP